MSVIRRYLEAISFLAALANVTTAQTTLQPSHQSEKPASGVPTAVTDPRPNQKSNVDPALLAERDRLLEQADELQRKRELPEAIAKCEQVLALERRLFGNEHEEVIDTLRLLAHWREQANDFTGAKLALSEVLEIRTTQLGKQHWQAFDARQALNDVELRAKLTPDQRLRLLEIKDAKLRMDELYRRGRFAEVTAWAKNALKVHREILGNNHPETAQSLNNLGHLYQVQGDYASAAPMFEEALAVRLKVLGENHPETSTSLSNLALLCKTQGHFQRAEELYRRAFTISKGTLGENHPDTVMCLNNLATLYHAQADYARAAPLLEQALSIRRSTLGESHPDTAMSLNNLAALYQEQGDFARALQFSEQALGICKKVFEEDDPRIATCLSNLANLCQSHGDYARAASLFEQALAIRRKVLGENHADTALNLNNLAALYFVLHDYDRAAPLFERALAINKTAFGDNHPLTASAINNLGVLCNARGDITRAMLLHEQALAIRKMILGDNHPDTATSVGNLAGIYQDQGDYARAAALFEESLRIRKNVFGVDHPDTASGLNNLAGVYYVQGDYARATPLFAQALGIILHHIETTAFALTERQQLLHTQVARSFMDNNLSCLLHFDDRSKDALANVLRWKGAITMRQRTARIGAESASLAPLFAELQSVTRRWARLAQLAAGPENAAPWRQQLSALTKQKEELEAELSRRSSVFRQMTKKMTPDDVAATLPAQSVLVDYFEFSRAELPKNKLERVRWTPSLVVFVIRRDAPVTMIDLGEVAPIVRAIDTWRKSFGKSDEAQAAGQVLRAKLWQPLEAAIGDAKLVLVSPDGALGRLPFAALPGRKPHTYLIEDHRLAMIPVPQLIPNLASDTSAAQQKAQRILLLGGVDYDHREEGKDITPPASTLLVGSVPHEVTRGIADDHRWGDLPGTSAEVADVEKLYRRLQSPQTNTVTRLSGATATEDRFRALASQHRVLHLATHGYFASADKESALSPHGTEEQRASRGSTFGDRLETARGYSPGLLSGLVLAGANHPPDLPNDPAQFDKTPDDGILTADEIAFLPLGHVDLVVLSACETGLGETAGGEGLLGIQRAFQIAGARSTVASLWKVNDDATRVLMTQFYTNLWEKKLSRVDALRQAQLSMLHGYDPASGTLRGAGGAAPVDPKELAQSPKTKDNTAGTKAPPAYWAAFVLSGDWQ